MYILILQRLFLEAILDIFYFPVWWYTRGAGHAGKWCWEMFKHGNNNLAPGLWLANLFVPMFGQYDFQGRLVSFFMRLVQIIARAFALLVWFGVCLAFFSVWLILPILIIRGMILAF